MLSGFVLGFATGVLALGVVLYSTGRFQPKLPTPAPPDTTMPTATQQALPAPPNAALTAPPAATVSMPVTDKLNTPGKLDSATMSAGPGLGLPLPNLKREAIQDTFDDTRGGGTKHEATDILAARGTPVFAVAEGNVVKLFNSKKGGTTVYQYDDRQKYCYYYAHLERYADGLKEGMLLRKGDTLGYVGTTGDAQPNNPHLHFAILELGPDKHWYEHTTAVNPYPLLIHALTVK